MIFKDRIDAGQQLVLKLKKYKNDSAVVIIGLPRGGVVVANEVAKNLNLPLDIIVSRKIGAPNYEELAIGAISENNSKFFNQSLINNLKPSAKHIQQTINKETKEMNRRLVAYRGTRPPLNLTDKTAILVDDGIATGATIKATIGAAKAKGATKIIVAVPVTTQDEIANIHKMTDEFIYLDAPYLFGGVGAFYDDFKQIADKEITKIMKLESKNL